MTEFLEFDGLFYGPFPCGTLAVCASVRFGVPVQNLNHGSVSLQLGLEKGQAIWLLR